MKVRIERVDKALESRGNWTWKELNIQPTLGEAYRYSIKAENELPNYYDVIWNEHIDAILECMKREGITEFTVSSTFSGLIETIAQFTDRGCVLNGIIRINDCWERDRQTGERLKIPAFKMTIN